MSANNNSGSRKSFLKKLLVVVERILSRLIECNPQNTLNM